MVGKILRFLNKNKLNLMEMKKKRAINPIILIACAVLIILLIPLILGTNKSEVKFNQFYLEKVKKEYKAMSFSEKIDSFKSTYSLALNYFFTDMPKEVDYNDPNSMFNYLYANLPYYAIVYPSEMYYYYQFPVKNRFISGNLRLVMARQGQIGMGYFDKDEQEFSNHRLFGAEDGLIIEKKSDFLYKTKYKGKTVYFKLNDIIFDKPKKLTVLDREEFVTQVEDESGIRLFLYFNNETNSFYYILNEEEPVTDKLTDKGESIFIGERTDFAFYYDELLNRKVLFGVKGEHVSVNDYFDGPFDQVYPFLNIRDKIYKVYPYTQYGKGIDEHGNFLNSNSSRVAISPYVKYESIEKLKLVFDECLKFTENKQEFYSCLTYEGKKDYHLESPLFYQNGTLKKDEKERL